MAARVLICYAPGCFCFRTSPSTEIKSDPSNLQSDSITLHNRRLHIIINAGEHCQHHPASWGRSVRLGLG